MPKEPYLRYSHGVSVPRCRDSRQLIGYSPKLKRRVTHLNHAAFDAWLILESDPQVILKTAAHHRDTEAQREKSTAYCICVSHLLGGRDWGLSQLRRALFSIGIFSVPLCLWLNCVF